MRKTALLSVSNNPAGCHLSRIVPRAALITLISALSWTLVRAESYNLQPKKFPGQLQKVHVDYQVEGNLKVNPDGKGVRRLPMSVKATLLYDEQLRSPDTPLRARRYYRQADANLKIGDNELSPELSDDHRFIAVYAENDRWKMVAPIGNMTRDELDLITVQGSSAMISQLLPAEPQTVGGEWPHGDEVIRSLLNLHAISKSDVKSELKEVKDGVALVELSGSVSGAVDGIVTEIDIKAKYNVDVGRGLITWFVAAIREHRSVGHAVPGFEVLSQLRMQLKPLKQSDFVNDSSFPEVAEQPADESFWLSYESPQHGFRCLYDRRWQVMGVGPQVIVLRMVDRGDLIGQCNISKLTDSETDKLLALEKYQANIRQALGDHFGQFVEASQSMTPTKIRMLRVAVSGTVSKLPMQWIYYHLSDEQGRRVSCIVTVEDTLAERLAGTDSLMANTLELFDPPPRQASRESADKKNDKKKDSARSSKH